MSLRLCSINQVKNALQIPSAETGEDTNIGNLIDAVSYDCQAFTGRTFTATAYSNEAHRGGSDSIVARQYPIDSDETILVKSFDGTNWYTYDSSDYHVDDAAGIVRLRGGLYFPSGPDTARLTYTAGYASTGSGSDTRLDVPLDLAFAVRDLAVARFKKDKGAITEDELRAAEERARSNWNRYNRHGW